MNTGKNKLWIFLLFVTSLLPLFPGEVVSFPIGILEINFVLNADMFSWDAMNRYLWIFLATAQVIILTTAFVRDKKMQTIFIIIAPVLFVLSYILLNVRRDIFWSVSTLAASAISFLPFLSFWIVLLRNHLKIGSKGLQN